MTCACTCACTCAWTCAWTCMHATCHSNTSFSDNRRQQGMTSTIEDQQLPQAHQTLPQEVKNRILHTCTNARDKTCTKLIPLIFLISWSNFPEVVQQTLCRKFVCKLRMRNQSSRQTTHQQQFTPHRIPMRETGIAL